jgi:FkbH-like protein
MPIDICELPWLPVYEGNFKDACAHVKEGDCETLKLLMRHRLTYTQLGRIASIMRGCPDLSSSFEKLSVGILGDANNDFVIPALRASALRHGLWLDVTCPPMGGGVAAALNPASSLYDGGIDVVLNANTSHRLPILPLGDRDMARRVVDDMLAEVETLAEAVGRHSKATFLVQTIPTPNVGLFGSLDNRVAGTGQNIVSEFNASLIASEFPMLDVAALADKVGLYTWYDMNYWHWTKQPFSIAVSPLYADYCARHLAALRGKSKKCLVLDLDNTLWGGIIGDDGIERIELGQGSPKGEAYLAIQQMAKKLKARGIVLAVCSKNDENNAKLPFERHPESILSLNDFAVFVANWNDKASNVDEIAKTLNLTPDSFVFLDDNPAERGIVRQELPLVTVPEVDGKNPAEWPALLSAAGYFDVLTFTENDLQRAEQYCANAKRVKFQSSFRDIQSYLKSLGMRLVVSSCSAENRSRVAQLIGRSNQYNLTTRRYTEEQLVALESGVCHHCYAARLTDKFGDNGIICVVICEVKSDGWYLDSWLLSCRVLGRGVEAAILNYVAEQAARQGCKRLIGHYIPSAKNKMTETHYEKLGFTRLSEDIGGTYWELSLEDYTPRESVMEIIDRTDG